ncbi:DNA-directed DNA polymerase [Tanacetum coccineum]|uniref:DNA-directed DNA polymerase n=1 Tax=Tanacetum coccineum TaxID=301880 RepID=A0ABQ5A188_9ASTR
MTREALEKICMKLDVEIAIDEEEATEEVIRGYKTIREKNNPRVFVLLIRIKGKFDTPALANTGSNINVLPYRIYEKLGKEEVKHVSMKITMLDHSKAEPLGILKYVLSQVGTSRGSNDDDEDEYIIKRDKNGKPIYDLKFAKYLNCDDLMDLPLQHNEWIPSYSDNFIKKGNGDGKWHAKVRIVDPYGNVYDQGPLISTLDFLVFIIDEGELGLPRWQLLFCEVGLDWRVMFLAGGNSGRGSEFQDTAISSKKKVAKAFTFYKMETQEESDRYITHCFVSGLHAYDGEINLENEKNMISNEFAVKLLLDYEEKNGETIMKKELLVALNGELLTKGIVNFGNRVITIYPVHEFFADDSDKSNDLRDDLEAILEGINFGDIPQLDGIDVPPFVCNMRKSSQNKNKPCRKYKMTYSDEGPSLIVKKTLTREEMTREALEKICMKGKFDTHALANTGSNINVLPYRIYEKLGRGEVKPVSMKITMLDHSKAEPMGILKYVLCQVGVTTIREKFLILDIPVDKDVPIVVGKKFSLYLWRNYKHYQGTTLNFDGVCHQKFYVAAVRNMQEESDDDDEEEYIMKRDKNGKPVYGLKFAKYLNCDDPMNRALALQEALNPFRKICNGDGKWHAKVRIVDPYGNVYDQGSEKNFIETSGKNDFEAGSSSLPKITLQHETVEEAMLPYEEIFTSEAWRRAFDIREHVCAELCHEFYATYEFDETVTDEELMSRKENIFALSSDEQCGIHGSFREFLRE